MRIGIEPLNRYETSVVNTVEQTLEMITGLPSVVGLMIDTYHLNIEEANPYAALAALCASATVLGLGSVRLVVRVLRSRRP